MQSFASYNLQKPSIPKTRNTINYNKEVYTITNIFKVSSSNNVNISGKLGTLSISMCPGKKDTKHVRDLDTDLQQIMAAKVDVIVCLLPWSEMRSLKIADYPAKVKRLHIPFYHVPITDMGIPDYRQLDTIIPIISSFVEEGLHVLVHCRCGLGRAGTICACCLGYLGYDWVAAIELVRSKRSGAIQNSIQERCIMKYCNRLS